MGIKNRRVDLYRGVKAPARDVVANRWDRRPFEAVARLSRSYLRVWGNNDNNLTRNGERRVLERLRFDSAPVVFDVGANRGDWTARGPPTPPRCNRAVLRTNSDNG